MVPIASNTRVTKNQEIPNGAERVNLNPAAHAPFDKVLSVQFSKHANTRLNDRNINLTGEQIDRVQDGIVRANEKGIRDSLVLVDDIALVVNVRSRTVITALQHGSEHVFSNIDGAVIV